MSADDRKICSLCKHVDGYRCKSEHIPELAALVTGLQITGCDADTFTMRLSESACGVSGKWWESRE
jgi:hypothetical protein